MASEHTVADNIVYDLVSIQYHALKAAQVYDTYVDDAHGEHEDIAAFLRQCKSEDEQRALRCHEFLTELTKGSGIG